MQYFFLRITGITNNLARMELNNSQTSNCCSDTSSRGEVDTSNLSKQQSLAMFKDKIKAQQEEKDRKCNKSSVSQHRMSTPTQAQLLLSQQEVRRLQQQLKQAELSKAQALRQLNEANSLVRDLSLTLEIAKKSEENARTTTEAVNFQIEDFESAGAVISEETKMLQAEIFEEKLKFWDAKVDLVSARKECDKWKEKLSVLAESKQSTVMIAEKAEIALQRRLDKINLVEAHKAALYRNEAHSGCLPKDHKTNLEVKMVAAELFIESLLKQIEVAINSKALIDADLNIACEKLHMVESEMEQVKHEIDKNIMEESKRKQLEEDKKSAWEELEQIRKGIAEMKTREIDLQDTRMHLIKEIDKVKAQLTAVTVSENKARKDAAGLSLSVQEIAEETEAAKKNAANLKQKAQEAKLEVEKQKAALRAAEFRLQSSLAEANAAKAAERIAHERLNKISPKTTDNNAVKSDPAMTVTISREEYDFLKRVIAEADDIANLKVMALTAEADAVKASEQELQMELELVNKQNEELNEQVEETLVSTEKAETARRLLEANIRRLKEQDQRKNAMVFATVQECAENQSINVVRNQAHDDDVGEKYNPFYKALNIKPEDFTSPEMPQKGQSPPARFTSISTSKKKHFSGRLERLFSRKQVF